MMHAQAYPEPVPSPMPTPPPPAPPGTELPGPGGEDISLPPIEEPVPAI
jgi:hypothetical protein